MKKIAVYLSAITISFFASGCGDDSSKTINTGDEQLEEPVMNSGPNTEGRRAVEAVADSANAGSDSTVHVDKDAMSTPH